jgi:hypothetical protein
LKRALSIELLIAVLALVCVLPARGVAQAPTNQVSAPHSRDAHDWKRYRYNVDGFTVEFPAEPHTAQHDSKTGTRYFASLDNGNLAYFVEAAVLPADLNKSSMQLFDDYISGAAKGTKSQIKYSKDISLHGNPGREATLENETLVLQFRLYVVQHKLYQVLVVAMKDQADSAETEHFQSSFDLL